VQPSSDSVASCTYPKNYGCLHTTCLQHPQPGLILNFDDFSSEKDKQFYRIKVLNIISTRNVDKYFLICVASCVVLERLGVAWPPAAEEHCKSDTSLNR